MTHEIYYLNNRIQLYIHKYFCMIIKKLLINSDNENGNHLHIPNIQNFVKLKALKFNLIKITII